MDYAGFSNPYFVLYMSNTSCVLKKWQIDLSKYTIVVIVVNSLIRVFYQKVIKVTGNT